MGDAGSSGSQVSPLGQRALGTSPRSHRSFCRSHALGPAPVTFGSTQRPRAIVTPRAAAAQEEPVTGKVRKLRSAQIQILAGLSSFNTDASLQK